MPNKRYQELLFSSQKKLDISAEQIRKLIPTSGEIGTLIEEMFRSYLAEVLPEKIGVSNGFVMDSDGNESKQMDIILYDKMNTSRIFTSSAANAFPVESTYACGEIKTHFNTKELEDSFKKCLSYKNLNRKAYFSGGRKIIVNTHKLFGEDKEHWESIFFSISVESIAGNQLLMEYQRIMKADRLPVHKRIDTMFSLNCTDGKNIIANRDEEELDLLPNKNSRLYAISVEKSWALFINLLLRYMVQVPTEPVNMLAYSGSSLHEYRDVN